MEVLTLLAAASSSQASGTIDAGTAQSSCSLTVTVSGSPAFSVQLQGSSDAVTWVSAGSAATTAGTTSISPSPAARYFRAVLSGFTGPGSVTAKLGLTGGTGFTGAPAASGSGLTPVAVKTSAYTAAPGDLVPVDTTSGPVTVTLPTAPAALTVIGVKMVILGGTNTVSVAAGGSDVFNKAGGSTSLTLSRALQTITVQYASGIWYVISTDPAISLPLPAASMAAGTTSARGALQLDGTATDIQPPGTQAAGATGKAADAGHVHPQPSGFLAADAGYLEWAYDPVAITTQTALANTGGVYLIRVNVRVARSVTNVIAYLGVLGSSLTSSENFAGLYSSTGTLIGTSADQTTTWNTGGSTGLKTIALTGGPFAVSAGFCWVALLFNGTTGPAFGKAGNVSSVISNAGFTASTARFAITSGSNTSLPGSFTPSASTLQGNEYWAAIS